MPTKIDGPSIIEAPISKPKRIDGYIGKVNSGTGTPDIRAHETVIAHAGQGVP
jgi:hypothetical protein